MKWVNTFSSTVGIFLVLIAVLNFGCKSHSPESFSNSDYFQQRVMIQFSPSTPENLLHTPVSDSIQLQDYYRESSEQLFADDLIQSVDWEHRQSSPDVHKVTFEIEHIADSVSTEIFACDQVWKDTIHCSEIAYFEITAMKGERSVTYRDSINLKLLNELFVVERSEN